ncbi:MAG: hypothetical protein COU51_03090 [Parcubacteria group bacterium CG10_big_fil_rev_8_21_14_0_10_36_14]|nr:MAG: hypothetical protein COU51_03090 [Parcubacteria group bacterium CG10_big_fil_rev_8_21_14_0_10_36_14]
MFKDEKQLEEFIFLIYSTKKRLWESLNMQGVDVNSAIRFASLQFIIEKEKPTMKDLASFLHIKPPSATILINGLVRFGFIKRKSDTKDRRITRLRITEKGKDYFDKTLKKMSNNVRTIFTKLSEQEIGELIKILKKLYYATTK